MRKLHRPAGVAVALLVVTGCASGGTATTEPTTTAAPTTSVPTTTAAPATTVAKTVAAPTTTSAATMSDLEVIEAGVAAFYSGDAERAAELFVCDG